MNKEILRLAIPNILSNISVPLLSTVDTALMGHISGANLGAVGVGSMIFNFLYWNFGFLRMGTTGLSAQAYGKNDHHATANILGRAMLLVFILSLFLLLLQYPLGKLGFYLMNIQGEQQKLVSEYFHIRIWATPAALGLYAFFGWFFGVQNAIYPLILTIIINIVNISLSYLLVYHLDYGIAGVAWGTVAAQYTGLIIALTLFLIKYKNYRKKLSYRATIQITALKRFLLINRDIFIRTLALTFVFGFFYSNSAAESELILAVNVILLQFLNWMSYGIDGFAYASESLVGKYYGAKNKVALTNAIKQSFFWGLLSALFFSLTYWIAGEKLLSIFTNQPEIIEAAKAYLIWLAVLPVVGFGSYIWDGVYIGLTASKEMRNSMLISLGIFLITFYFTSNILHNHGLWIALLLFLLTRGIIQYWLFQKTLRKQILKHTTTGIE